MWEGRCWSPASASASASALALPTFEEEREPGGEAAFEGLEEEAVL